MTRSITFVNFFLSLHFSVEFCIILALSFDGRFDMKNEASDASWIGTVTSILLTNAKTVTNYTYVMLLRVSITVALLNSFKSMYLDPVATGPDKCFNVQNLQGSTFRDFGTRGNMQVFDRQIVQNFVAELARSRVNGLHR